MRLSMKNVSMDPYKSLKDEITEIVGDIVVVPIERQIKNTTIISPQEKYTK